MRSSGLPVMFNCANKSTCQPLIRQPESLKLESAFWPPRANAHQQIPPYRLDHARQTVAVARRSAQNIERATSSPLTKHIRVVEAVRDAISISRCLRKLSPVGTQYSGLLAMFTVSRS